MPVAPIHGPVHAAEVDDNPRPRKKARTQPPAVAMPVVAVFHPAGHAHPLAFPHPGVDIQLNDH